MWRSTLHPVGPGKESAASQSGSASSFENPGISLAELAPQHKFYFNVIGQNYTLCNA